MRFVGVKNDFNHVFAVLIILHSCPFVYSWQNICPNPRHPCHPCPSGQVRVPKNAEGGSDPLLSPTQPGLIIAPSFCLPLAG
jgi:hypothetical protein